MGGAMPCKKNNENIWKIDERKAEARARFEPATPSNNFN